MKHLAILFSIGLCTVTLYSHAGDPPGSGDTNNNTSMLVYRAAQHSQATVQTLGRIDTLSPAGRAANRLIQQGRLLQRKLLMQKGKPLAAPQIRHLHNEVTALVDGMDRIQTIEPSQRACLIACDRDFGPDFAEGKGWNRFWCKAECFKAIGMPGTTNANKAGTAAKPAAGKTTPPRTAGKANTQEHPATQ